MIKEFQGNFRWLSNFVSCRIILHGIEYPSVEHAYMSAKSEDPSWKLFCATVVSPGDVKRASKKICLVAGWESKKVSIMRECLRQKYSQEPYRSKLLATGEEELQEGNMWNDTFWGVSLRTGKGQNILGKLIMEIREELI